MAIQIHIHASLKRYCNDQETLEIEKAASTTDLLNQLTEKYPKLKPILFNTENELNPYIIIYINGNDIRYLEDDTAIPDNTKVDIMTSLVGG